MIIDKRMLLTGLAAGWLAVGAPALAEQAEPKVACKEIKTAAQLQKMFNDFAGIYCLANDIDAGSISFNPVGDGVNHFTGRLYGKNHVIKNLSIDVSTGYVALFGYADGAIVQDLSLVDINYRAGSTSSYVGGVFGFSINAAKVINVFVSGKITAPANSYIGGVIGYFNSMVVVTNASTAVEINGGHNSYGGGIGGFFLGSLRDSQASGSVTGGHNSYVGGLIGYHTGEKILRSHATGAVSTGAWGYAGGIAGFNSSGTIQECYATGAVKGGHNGYVGGLEGYSSSGTTIDSFATGAVTRGGDFGYAGGLAGFHSSGTFRRVFALGAVTSGDDGYAGGLFGYQGGGTTSQAYAVGRVSGGTGTSLGGIAGGASTAVANSTYFVMNTTGQGTGPIGTGVTTDQLRGGLPAGFGTQWGISKKLSFPFLKDPDLPFIAPLATLVPAPVLIFLPISQLDERNYGGSTAHIDQASLATIYTMLARAVGIGESVGILRDVKTSKYFWNDNSQTTTFKGPVTDYIELGALKNIGANAPIGTEVINKLRGGNLVILRGTFTKGSGTATHYILATMYTKKGDGSPDRIVANDPWTGTQVAINLATKTVVGSFPLKNFKVDGYQPASPVVIPSDRRLKRDIVRVARLKNGLGLYRYRYLWSDQLYVGVMAQEVARIKPRAVLRGSDGYLRVNYARLGLRLQTWDEWLAAHGKRGPGKRIAGGEIANRAVTMN